MKTQHRILIGDSRRLAEVEDGCVQIVVTSPPYPMVEMWDECFALQSPQVRDALQAEEGWTAFEAMHRELDRVWNEVARVVCEGGIICINIGDATRSVKGRFRLYSNHSRIIEAFVRLGFDTLPNILWRKPTNAPNKFMGSGMLPAGAYVTLEHEYLLVFRKGGKRMFRSDDTKRLRNASAFFWEERNQWFSDVWNIKGVRQRLTASEARERSGAFPFEIAYRLLLMYSVYGDTVLDPFVGTGTTMAAALAAGRSSIGADIDAALKPVIERALCQAVGLGNERTALRVREHLAFVREQRTTKGELQHRNNPHGFAVVTRQEKEMLLRCIERVEPMMDGEGFMSHYTPWNMMYSPNAKGAAPSLFADEVVCD